MKKFLTFLIIFLALVLETTVLADLNFRGVLPDLLLVITVSLALLRGRKEGVLWGGVSGFFQELLIAGHTLTGYLLLKPLLGLVSGILTEKIYRENIILPAIIVFLLTFIQEYLVLLLHNGLIANWLQASLVIIMPAAIINFVLTLIIYPLLMKWEEREERATFF
ncbi:MAG: rod shape-determining protein MreD [Halanaerobium sp.]|nr:rod shape-determining protein MreD [Halanaerobium sp.]